MRTRERLTGLKNWATRELCTDREMKAPSADMDIAEIIYREPECFLAWTPQRLDQKSGQQVDDFLISCPSIIIMPNASKAKAMEEKRFDRYSGIHRPKEMGQTLSVSMLFSVYEPGIRETGFVYTAERQDGIDMDDYPACKEKHGIDMRLLREGTEEGLFTLTDWMDECKEKLLAVNSIPGTDLFVDDDSMIYSLYTDQSYVVDKRPIYYGFVNVEFTCHADMARNSEIERLLD